MPRSAVPALALLLAAAPLAAQARTVCTVIADADGGRIVAQEGDCATRVTPASTFKIPLALMGFDAGILVDERAPTLERREGEPDWGGAAWRQPTDPAHWMKHSVVWYSQRITKALGLDRFKRAVAAYGYGNADVSGDPGRGNALERSWIGSSLKISPIEQTAFLAKFVNRTLPARPEAFDSAYRILEAIPVAGGWTVRGKTGMAYPRRADGSFDRDRAWGWYVGFAEKGARTLVFARLDQEERAQPGSAGQRARDALLAELPARLDRVAGNAAPDPKVTAWAAEKCVRYKAAWSALAGRRGLSGLGPDFLASHDAFLASGCLAKADVCPRSPAELEVANMLVMAAMTAGTASTFLPFACRKS